MALDLLKERGVPLDKQTFTWKDLSKRTYSKLDDDAFTRVRVILMNGIESEAVRFQHMCARFNRELREPLALIRRVEHHQQTLVNWLNPPDQSALETTLGFEQVAIEITAAVAQQEPDPYHAQAYRFGMLEDFEQEPDPYHAQAYRFGMLEDFDHLYRYSALYDRVYGRDPNNILQSYTDVVPGRPTSVEHRHPLDDVRRPYDKRTAHPLTKLNALTITAAEHQTHDYYMNVGPQFNDPVARALYAEIASIEEQHVTHYESLMDPSHSLLEQWLLHEAMEAYNYYSCVQSEGDPVIKSLWERFLDYELGHLAYVKELFQRLEGRDAAEVLPEALPDPIRIGSNRAFVRQVLETEVDLRANGTEFVPASAEDERSQRYREQINSEGSPSETVAAGYHWRPGTELTARLPYVRTTVTTETRV